jgi:hypothetical protein
MLCKARTSKKAKEIDRKDVSSAELIYLQFFKKGKYIINKFFIKNMRFAHPVKLFQNTIMDYLCTSLVK